MVKQKRKPSTSCVASLKSGCSCFKVVESRSPFQEAANEFRRLLQMIRLNSFVPWLMIFGSGSWAPPTALLSFPMQALLNYGNTSMFPVDGRSSLLVSRRSMESTSRTITISPFQLSCASFQKRRRVALSFADFSVLTTWATLAFKSSFKQSNYITDFWNWFMTLMSKAAEMVLFGTVLYSGYQLLPGVPHVPAPIDAAVFVIQQGALDIGGMGLLKLAKRANLSKDSFPVRLGVSLVVLMNLNVALASIKHTLPMIPDGVFVGIETLLLIARAVVAVLFGHAIHALREEYGESTITIKEASELQQHIEALASELAQGHVQVQQRLQTVQTDMHMQWQGEIAHLQDTMQVQMQALQASIQVHVQGEIA